MTTIRLTGDTQRNHAVAEVLSQPLDGTVQVVIKEYRRKRSNSQNRLMWMWCDEWAKHEHETDVELQHHRLKWRYGRSIFIVKQPELVDMVAAIDAIHGSPEYGILSLAVAANMRSSKLLVGEMNDYLTKLETEARQRGIELTVTGDRYNVAMNRKEG